MESIKFEEDETIYCKNENVYEEHLIKRRTYKVIEVGRGTRVFL